MELFSLQMFDNERGVGGLGGWGEKWNIHEQRTLWRLTPGSGCQNSSVPAFEEAPLKKNTFPPLPQPFIIILLLRSSTLLRVTLKYLPKPELERKGNCNVFLLDIFIFPRKIKRYAWDSNSQGK